MTRSTYVLSLASAAALGAGTAQLADFDARAAIPAVEDYTSTTFLADTHPMILAIQNAVQTNLCPEVNAKFDLSGSDECTIPRDIKRLTIQWNDPASPEKAIVYGYFELSGSWTPGEPQ